MKFFIPIFVVILGLNFKLNAEVKEVKEEEKLICEGQSQKLECKDKLTVNIKSAEFIQKANICDGVVDGQLVCTSTDLTSHYNKMCVSKNSCEITANKSSTALSEKCTKENLLLKLKYICSDAKTIFVKYNVAYILLFVGLFVYSM